MHKHFEAARPHFEKQHNPYRGGIADVWYSGGKGDLWIEYKYIGKIPARGPTMIIPNLSPGQLDWLHNRATEGRCVGLILGTPRGGVMMPPSTWITGMSVTDFCAALQSRKELAQHLFDRVGVGCFLTYTGDNLD